MKKASEGLPEDNLALQASSHSLVQTGEFPTLEDIILHLTHMKAYEDACDYAEGKAVLDIGCNIGYGSYLLAEHANEVIGIDVSRKAIRAAESRFRSDNLRFQLVDGIALPFDDEEFGCITCFQVIEHITDVPAFLGEVNRVLRPGGIVLFTTPNAAIRLVPGMKPWNRFHVQEWTGQGLESLLRPAFSEVKVIGLFAEADLYRIEYQRNVRRRERYRKIQANRYHPRSLLVQLLPEAILECLKSIRKSFRQKAFTQAWTTEQLARFSTADFRYLEENLDESLNLMAICYKN